MSIFKHYIEKKLFLESSHKFNIYSYNTLIDANINFSYLNFKTCIISLSNCEAILDSNLNLLHFKKENYNSNSESLLKEKINSSIKNILNLIKKFDKELLNDRFYISSEFNILNYLAMFVFCSENTDVAKKYFDSIPARYLAKTIYLFSHFFKVFSDNYSKSFNLNKLDIQPLSIQKNIELPFFDLFIDICNDKIKLISFQDMKKYFFKDIYFLKPAFIENEYTYLETLYGKFSQENKGKIIHFLNSNTKNDNDWLIQPEKFFNLQKTNNINDSLLQSLLIKKNQNLLPFYSILFKNLFNNFEIFKDKFNFNLKYISKRSLNSQNNEISLDIFIEKYSFSIYLYFANKYNTFDFSDKSIYYHFLFYKTSLLNSSNLDNVSIYYKTFFINFFTVSKDENMFFEIVKKFMYFKENYTDYKSFFKEESTDIAPLFSYLFDNGKIKPNVDFSELVKNNPLFKNKYLYASAYAAHNRIKDNAITINSNYYNILLEQYKLKKEFDNF